MSTKQGLKANYAVETKHGAFYTGGKVQFSADGAKMLCKCADKVNALDVATGTITHAFCEEEDGEVSTFVLSPDDKILVVALRHLLLKQFDFETNENTRTWKAIHTSPVNTMAFDTTSTLLATGGSDSTIKVWDVIQQYCTHNLKGHRGVITALLFHPDPARLQLFTAGEDYTVRVWDLASSACVASLAGHYSVVTAITVTGDQRTAYTAGRDKVVNVWDLETYSKTRTIPVYETLEGLILLDKSADNSKLNVKSDADHFITAGSKGLLRVWDASTAQCVFSQTQLIGGRQTTDADDTDADADVTTLITDAMTCQQTQSVAVVSYDHNVFVYNAEDLSARKQFAGYNDEVLDVRYLGPAETHLAVATNSPLIKVFSLSSWDVQFLRGHTDIVLALDVYKSGTLLASSSKDNRICVWQMDVDTSVVSLVATAYGHTNEIQSVAFPKLSSSFLVSGSQDLTLKLWSLPETYSDVTMTTLTTVATEKAHDKEITVVTVAPNDKLVATGSLDKTAKLWSAETLSLLGVFRGHKRGLWDVKFSSVDQCIATASSDCTVKIWALTDYSCVKTFEGHDALVLQVHFVSRGMQLLTSGSDGLLKLWTIRTSECVKTYDAHDDKVWALAVSRDEERLVTGGGDSQIVVWKDVTETELEEQRNKQVDGILKEQKLLNLLQQKKFFKALTLSIAMEQPFRALNIIKEILSDPDSKDDLAATLRKLRKDQLDAILRFCVQWNTNSRHCHVAQTVVTTVIRTTAPETLLGLSNARSALEGLLPYTEKHFSRMNRLLQQSMFVDYTWAAMRLASGDALTDLKDPLGAEPSTARTSTEQMDMSDEDSSDDSSDGDKLLPRVSKTPESESSEESEDEDDDMVQPKEKANIKTSKRTDIKESSSESSDESDSDDEMDIQKGKVTSGVLKNDSSSEADEKDDDDEDVESLLLAAGADLTLLSQRKDDDGDDSEDSDSASVSEVEEPTPKKGKKTSSMTQIKLKEKSKMKESTPTKKTTKKAKSGDGSIFSDKENSLMSKSDEESDRKKTPKKQFKGKSTIAKTPSTAPIKRTKKAQTLPEAKRTRRKSHA